MPRDAVVQGQNEMLGTIKMHKKALIPLTLIALLALTPLVGAQTTWYLYASVQIPATGTNNYPLTVDLRNAGDFSLKINYTDMNPGYAGTNYMRLFFDGYGSSYEYYLMLAWHNGAGGHLLNFYIYNYSLTWSIVVNFGSGYDPLSDPCYITFDAGSANLTIWGQNGIGQSAYVANLNGKIFSNIETLCESGLGSGWAHIYTEYDVSASPGPTPAPITSQLVNSMALQWYTVPTGKVGLNGFNAAIQKGNYYNDVKFVAVAYAVAGGYPTGTPLATSSEITVSDNNFDWRNFDLHFISAPGTQVYIGIFASDSFVISVQADPTNTIYLWLNPGGNTYPTTPDLTGAGDSGAYQIATFSPLWLAPVAPTPPITPTATPETPNQVVSDIVWYFVVILVLVLPAGVLVVLFHMGTWGALIGLVIGAALGYILMPTRVPIYLFFAIILGIAGYLLKPSGGGGSTG